MRGMSKSPSGRSRGEDAARVWRLPEELTGPTFA